MTHCNVDVMYKTDRGAAPHSVAKGKTPIQH